MKKVRRKRPKMSAPAERQILVLRAGPYSIRYQSAPGPVPLVGPKRDWTQFPLEYIEPWWAPHCPTDDPKAAPAPHVDKYWNGLYVDSPLKDEWLERMNAIPGIRVDLTDTGHGPGEILYNAMAFEMDPETPISAAVPVDPPDWRDRVAAYNDVRAALQRHFEPIAEVAAEPSSDPPRLISFRLVSWLPRIWMTECQFDAWWEEILARLEDMAATGWVI